MERISSSSMNNININIIANDDDHHHQQKGASSTTPSSISVPNCYTYNSPPPSNSTSPYSSHHSSPTSTSPTAGAAFPCLISNNINNNNNNSMSPAPPSHVVVMSPCAACKILRRRCVDKCVLAPYFPPTDPLKFTIAHRVFGASNIIKFLQELPESQRGDAVSSMVYEANARIRDPVYGCAGAICQLQKQIGELQAELAKAQAEVVSMQSQQANLVALIYMEMTQTIAVEDEEALAPPPPPIFCPNQHQHQTMMDTSCFLDDTILAASWDPLWT